MGEIIKDVAYGNEKDQLLDLYLPKNKKDFKTLVFFHGGGLEGGSKEGREDIFRILQYRGIAVVSANYSLYPKAKYPNFIEDAAQAVSWTFGKILKYGVCNGIYLGGSSAGAYISMLLCFDRRYLGKYHIDPNDLAGYVFDGGQPTTHFNVLRERGFDIRSVIIDEAAPLYHLRENPTHPPMLIIAAENDIPNRLEQTMLLRSTLKEFGYKDCKITLKIFKGYSHTGYCCVEDKNIGNAYTQLLYEFLSS